MRYGQAAGTDLYGSPIMSTDLCRPPMSHRYTFQYILYATLEISSTHRHYPTGHAASCRTPLASSSSMFSSVPSSHRPPCGPPIFLPIPSIPQTTHHTQFLKAPSVSKAPFHASRSARCCKTDPRKTCFGQFTSQPPAHTPAHTAACVRGLLGHV